MFEISSSGLKWRLLALDYGFFSGNSGAITLKKPFVQSQNSSILGSKTIFKHTLDLEDQKSIPMAPRCTLLLLLFLFCIPIISSHAQTTGMLTKTFRDAEAALLNHDYKKAIRLFEKTLKTHPDLAAAHRGLAVSYQLLYDYEEAAHHYEKVIELDSMFSRTVYFEAGEAQFKIGNYDRALELLEEFYYLQDFEPQSFGYYGDKEAEIETKYLDQLDPLLQACHMSLDSAKFQGIEEIINLGNRINTSSDEYFPCLTNDQQLMFYTRRRNKQADEDLYYSTYDERNGWSRGNALGPFNTGRNEGMSTLVRNNRTMFFTACGREGVLGTCDIWEAEIEDLKIKGMGALEGYSNSGKWESQAAVSCDGSLLFFASNREGGLGGTDLWYSRRSADGWSDPINLGPKINTKMDEESPFITNDGKTLYFASTGHPGRGEQDIFVSWLDRDDNWTVPINLGPPVNTAYRELGFFLSADGRTGYFASNRPGGEGGMDIYKFQLSKELYSDPITFVEGQVRDSLLDEPIVTTVYIEGREPMRTDEKGRFFLCMPADDSLLVRITEQNYHPLERNYRIPVWDNREFFTLDLRLEPIRSFASRAVDTTTIVEKPREKVETQHTTALFFEFDSDRLDLNGTNQLDDFMQALVEMEIVRVEIVGFADNIGADDYNLRLSEERAKNIALFMRDYGIIVHKIYLEGRGEINDEQPKSRNRRVEVRVYTLE